MMKSILALIFSLSIQISLAHAGAETGNGGFVVVDGKRYSLGDLHFERSGVEFKPDKALYDELKKIEAFYKERMGLVFKKDGDKEFFTHGVFDPYIEYSFLEAKNFDSKCDKTMADYLPNTESKHVGCTLGNTTYIDPVIFGNSKFSLVEKAFLIIHERLISFANKPTYNTLSPFVAASYHLYTKWVDAIRAKIDYREFNFTDKEYNYVRDFSLMATRLFRSMGSSEIYQVGISRQGLRFPTQEEAEKPFYIEGENYILGVGSEVQANTLKLVNTQIYDSKVQKEGPNSPNTPTGTQDQKVLIKNSTLDITNIRLLPSNYQGDTGNTEDTSHAGKQNTIEDSTISDSKIILKLEGRTYIKKLRMHNKSSIKVSNLEPSDTTSLNDIYLDSSSILSDIPSEISRVSLTQKSFLAASCLTIPYDSEKIPAEPQKNFISDVNMIESILSVCGYLSSENSTPNYFKKSTTQLMGVSFNFHLENSELTASYSFNNIKLINSKITSKSSHLFLHGYAFSNHIFALNSHVTFGISLSYCSLKNLQFHDSRFVYDCAHYSEMESFSDQIFKNVNTNTKNREITFTVAGSNISVSNISIQEPENFLNSVQSSTVYAYFHFVFHENTSLKNLNGLWLKSGGFLSSIDRGIRIKKKEGSQALDLDAKGMVLVLKGDEGGMTGIRSQKKLDRRLTPNKEVPYEK